MNSALIVSNKEKSSAYFVEMLTKAFIQKISVVTSASEAKRLLIEDEFDLCIINAPLSDENGENLARVVAQKGMSEVILIVKAEIYEEMSNMVEDYGVITVAKPINKALLWNAVKLAIASRKKYRLIQQENRRLLQKIEDIKVIDRAKLILVSCLTMSEQEAHKYIERQAMDMRVTRRAIAEEILKTYEN